MNDQPPVPAASNTFERIKRTNERGGEFWSARELAPVLEYSDFRNFITVITKAREACVKSGHALSNHFVEITEMVRIGSGSLHCCPSKSLLFARIICANADDRQNHGGTESWGATTESLLAGP